VSPDVLSKLQVAKPCPANWHEMRGTERVRNCTHCSRNVYNISAMSRREAAELIQANEGRVCVRYYTRVDGGVMTRECGQGIRASVRDTGRFAVVASLILGCLGMAMIMFAIPPVRGEGAGPVAQFLSDASVRVLSIFGPPPEPPTVMGKAAVARPVMGAPIMPSTHP